MKFTSKASFVGFLVAVSTLSVSVAEANQHQPEESNLTIENRLSRLTEAIKQRNLENNETTQPNQENQLMAGWLNGSNGGGWIRTFRPGWLNGGGFFNNRWPNGGGFFNNRWPDGGRFYRYW